MPSGKSHDAITLILAAPVFAVCMAAGFAPYEIAVGTGGFLFGGLMFGPDLDTLSVQFSRWSYFRFFWLPYRFFFRHRSRWSHGLIFGTLIRVIYFMGVLTISSFAAAYCLAAYVDGDLPNIAQTAAAWRSIGAMIREYIGQNSIAVLFFGLWLGAASHTLTDLTWSYIKTGRVSEFL